MAFIRAELSRQFQNVPIEHFEITSINLNLTAAAQYGINFITGGHATLFRRATQLDFMDQPGVNSNKPGKKRHYE